MPTVLYSCMSDCNTATLPACALTHQQAHSQTGFPACSLLTHARTASTDILHGSAHALRQAGALSTCEERSKNAQPKPAPQNLQVTRIASATRCCVGRNSGSNTSGKGVS